MQQAMGNQWDPFASAKYNAAAKMLTVNGLFSVCKKTKPLSATLRSIEGGSQDPCGDQLKRSTDFTQPIPYRFLPGRGQLCVIMGCSL